MTKIVNYNHPAKQKRTLLRSNPLRDNRTEEDYMEGNSCPPILSYLLRYALKTFYLYYLYIITLSWGHMILFNEK